MSKRCQRTSSRTSETSLDVYRTSETHFSLFRPEDSGIRIFLGFLVWRLVRTVCLPSNPAKLSPFLPTTSTLAPTEAQRSKVFSFLPPTPNRHAQAVPRTPGDGMTAAWHFHEASNTLKLHNIFCELASLEYFQIFTQMFLCRNCSQPSVF